ncbi:twin-arginine translocase TatA/TatE family subunit [Leucobacter salsicius]|uniref:twin-arginine translocase TatA/TatE family subunit n=1 Tax=Leucobacter salsicius TaxID=664638 RepID=UPI00035E8B2B
MHMLAILFVILLMFGAPKLPGLAKSLGQSMRILKKEVSGETDEAAPASNDPTLQK